MTRVIAILGNHVTGPKQHENEPHLVVRLNASMPIKYIGYRDFSPLHFITYILHPMKPSHTYKVYPSSKRFSLDGKVFSTIVIANGEASFFVKALLVVPYGPVLNLFQFLRLSLLSASFIMI